MGLEGLMRICEKGSHIMNSEPDVYKELQKHLDKMPVGYPATKSGVELRLLKFLFTPEQAKIALGLDHKFRTVEQIYENVKNFGISLKELGAKLEEMVERGNTFSKKKNGAKVYASIPLVIGMLELQGSQLPLEVLQDVNEYFQEGFAAEYVSTKIPQTRVIPVGKSINAEHRIGTYDELRDIIEKAGDRIRIGECMCRNLMQKVGQTCKATRRQETCMAFRDFADLAGKKGWGRPISKEQALQIAEKNEEDGLVLQPANEQEPEFICSCCGDCCGILRMAKAMPRPVEVFASNFYALGNPDLCVACGTCVDRCQMDAVELRDSIAVVNLDRCIGCGLCVSTCPSEAIHLVKKEKELIPPKDMEALYETILVHKKALV
jgi:electron transport complex protein RnfB